jgi:hypothetical protein
MTPNRVVAVLTPLVFAPLAGAVAAWLAKHFPALGVSKNDLQEVFIGGALIALAPAAQWLHGWQKYEERQAEAEQALELANAQAGAEDEEEEDDERTDVALESDGASIAALLDELDGALAGLDRPALAEGEE